MGKRIAEDLDGFEFSAAGVVVPYPVDGPQVVFAHHGTNAFKRRDGRSHAGFGVEAVGAAAPAGVALFAVGLALQSILLPIAGGYVLVGSGHFDAAVSGDLGGIAGGRGDYGIRP